MASEWREVFLEDIAAELTVGHVGPMASEYVEQGIPFLRSQNVEPLRINDTDLKFITKDFHGRLKKSALSPGDVVIVRTGKPGACAVVPQTLPISNCSDLVIVRCGPDLDPRFLAYYVNSVATHHVNSHLVGAVQQHFNVGAARRLAVLLPDLDEQRAIVHILGTLDDKIELNRRMSETLEAMARALFKSWFVDFDPVAAKVAGLDAGLPAHWVDLFPNAFETSDIGKVPNAWKVGSILALGELLSGGTPKTDRPEYWGGTIGWASAKDVSQASDSFLLGTERTVTQLGLHESAARLVPALSSVVVARGATTGRMVIFEREMAMNQTCYALATTIQAPFTLYCALRESMEALVHSAHGSVFDTITTSTFESSRIVLPPSAVLRAFELQVAPMFQRVLRNTRESATLTEMRNSLLPRLVSGELRLKGASLEAAATCC